MVTRLFFVMLVASLCLVNPDASGSESSLPDGIIAEINLARTSPRIYAGFLRRFRRNFSDSSFTLPGSGTKVLTREGVAAVDEAIRFLSRQKTLPPLARSRGLAKAAMDLVKDEGVTGATGHSGNGGGMQQRIERHGRWQGRIGENISYGPASARMVVMELIIDDGVPDRGHRRNIFNPDFSVAGVACGSHPRFRNMCVIDFSSRFAEQR